MKPRGLRCVCGSTRFEVAGTPRFAQPTGNHFMRTLRRAWREARQADSEGAPMPPPFDWPLRLRCTECEHSEDLLLSTLRDLSAGEGDPPSRVESLVGVIEPATGRQIASPRESYRCRACRRGQVALGLGMIRDDRTARAAVEVTVRCWACERVARIAGWDDRPSAQEVELDHLYGRR